MDKIFISGIQYDSCVNGVGFRDVIYVSGCWHECMKHCHNKETHNKNNGIEYNIEYDIYAYIWLYSSRLYNIDLLYDFCNSTLFVYEKSV